MIHIDRPTEAPSILDRTFPDGKTERQRAIDHYHDPANRNADGTWKSFPFARYSHETVKQALNELFHFKCAYCESRYGGTQPVDVEHYRPKGGVETAGGNQQVGYYWLAADWGNLLPSCIDCNRTRWQEIPGGGEQKVGKGNRFPIVNEDDRATQPDEEAHEQRLLLHPCLDQPEQELEFVVEDPENRDREGLVLPALHAGGGSSSSAEASIRVYALQRKGLVDLRRDRLILVKRQIARVNRLLEEVRLLEEQPEGDPVVQSLLQRAMDDLAEEMKELARVQALDQPYLCMTRQCIDRLRQW